MAGINLQKESVSALDRARNKSHKGLQGENLVPEVLPVLGAGQFSAHLPPALAMLLEVSGGVRDLVMSGCEFGTKVMQISDSESPLM